MGCKVERGVHDISENGPSFTLTMWDVKYNNIINYSQAKLKSFTLTMWDVKSW